MKLKLPKILVSTLVVMDSSISYLKVAMMVTILTEMVAHLSAHLRLVTLAIRLLENQNQDVKSFVVMVLSIPPKLAMMEI